MRSFEIALAGLGPVFLLVDGFTPSTRIGKAMTAMRRIAASGVMVTRIGGQDSAATASRGK
jgi:hypothetical protein